MIIILLLRNHNEEESQDSPLIVSLLLVIVYVYTDQKQSPCMKSHCMVHVLLFFYNNYVLFSLRFNFNCVVVP